MTAAVMVCLCAFSAAFAVASVLNDLPKLVRKIKEKIDDKK